MKGEGNSLDFGARMYDPRVGRFFSIDKLDSATPSTSGYSISGNSPIYKIDNNGDIEIIIHFYKKINGQYYKSIEYKINIETTEDLKGITRDVMHIDAYTRYDDGINQNNENIFKGVAFYKIRDKTGLNKEERMQEDDFGIFLLAKFMQKNPLGTGALAEAMSGEDMFTGEKLDKISTTTKLIESAISIVTLGRGNSVSKIFTGWLADLGVEEVTAKWLLNDDNIENGNLYGKITNFIYATYKMKDVDIKEKIDTISAIYNKGLKGKEFFDEVLNQTGINLDAPSGKYEAAKKAIEIINSEF